MSIKQRRLTLDRPLMPDMADSVRGAVREMMGIERIEVNGDLVPVTYDLMQATESQNEAEIARAGAMLGQGWSERLRRAFVHYREETEIESLAGCASSGGQCHLAPGWPRFIPAAKPPQTAALATLARSVTLA